MEKLKLEINGNIVIEYEDKKYKSTIQDIRDREFLINIPVLDGEYLTLNAGSKFTADYYAEGGNYYEFDSTVISRVVEKNLPMYIVYKPEKAHKIQRRNFVRVSLTEYAIYKKTENEECEWHQGVLLDLSGGGLKIKVKEEIKMNEQIIVNLYCDEETYAVKGKTVRCDVTEDREYICGIEFCELDERKRDKIIEKVFTVMRKQRELM